MTDAKRLNTLITELGQVCAIVLANSPELPKELRRLVTLHMDHEIKGHNVLRLDNQLRASDNVKVQPALRLAIGVLLLSIELAPKRRRK